MIDNIEIKENLKIENIDEKIVKSDEINIINHKNIVKENKRIWIFFNYKFSLSIFMSIILFFIW
jgi:hypothetical protein